MKYAPHLVLVFLLMASAAYAGDSPNGVPFTSLQNQVDSLNKSANAGLANMSSEIAKTNQEVSFLSAAFSAFKNYVEGAMEDILQQLGVLGEDISEVNETAESAASDAARANVRLDSLSSSLCIGELSPVCGSNGKTYINYCEANNRANISVSANKSCSECALTSETCNGADDNCNGNVDENISPVSCGVGACTNTAPGCMNGTAGICIPKAPLNETCDGIDNDCNGLVDDGDIGAGTACDGADADFCNEGIITCSPEGAFVCSDTTADTVEFCGDLIDNDCDGAVDEGFDFNNDVNNCGGCGMICANPTNGGAPLCNNGACGIAYCNAGWYDCDSSAANGCEAHTSNDVNNCGACGQVCANVPNGARLCNNGACGISYCNVGWSDCDGSLANGCEAHTSNDVNNCGGCGKVCPSAPAEGYDHVECINSVCTSVSSGVGGGTSGGSGGGAGGGTGGGGGTQAGGGGG